MARPAVSVKLLGSILVEVNGQVVTSFRSHKTLALLAYLIAERRPVARNYLAELFWPEAATADGRGHLRRALHDLSQKLPRALLADYYTVEFDPTVFPDTDLAQLDALRLQGDEAALQEAAALCRGQFLEGVTLDDCPAYEAWLAVERETWLRKATEVLDRLQQHYVRAARYDLALDTAWQLLRLEPWHEERYYQLMVLLARCGHGGAAIKVYRRYRRALVDDLNIEPSSEIETLYERIRRARVRHPGNLPRNLTPFVGRARELDLLAGYLADPACRLITLTGPGGIGKTRLAVEAALRANSSGGYMFLDGAFLIRLESLATPTQFMASLAHSLGLTSGGRNVAMDLVLRHLYGQELLLLLDDFDHLIIHKELLLTLLENVPGLKMLVTCQERLNLAAEWNIPLRGLASDETGLAGAEAQALFQKCLQRYGRFPLSPREKEIAARVCRLVDGMPLALELAASWMSSGAFDHTIEELEANLDVLALREAHPTRHTSVRAALDYTWARLSEEERYTLQLLAVFPSDFAAEAASRIALVTPAQLTTLVDRSLVNVNNGGEGWEAARYHLHTLVRKYAAEKLAGDPDLHAQVHAAHLVYLSETTAQMLTEPSAEIDGPMSLFPPRRLLPAEHCIML